MLGSTIRTTSAPRSEVPASASGATSGARHAALPAGSAKTMRTRPGASDVTVIRSVAEGGRRSRRAADDQHHDPEDDADDGEGDPDPAQDHADVAQVAVVGLSSSLRLLALVPEDHGRDAGGQTEAGDHYPADAEDQGPGSEPVLLGSAHRAVAGRRHRRRLAVPAVARCGRAVSRRRSDRCPIRSGRWRRWRRWYRYAAGGLLWSRVRVLR